MIGALSLAVALTVGAAAIGTPQPVNASQVVDSAAAAVDRAELDAMTRRVASQLRCPVCQGLSIQDSPTELAQNMRSVVREQLAEGRTPDDVKAYFVSRYGEWILLEPEPRGFNLTIYVLPVLAVLAGAAVVTAAIRRWSSRPLAAGRSEPSALDEPELEPWDEPIENAK